MRTVIPTLCFAALLATGLPAFPQGEPAPEIPFKNKLYLYTLQANTGTVTKLADGSYRLKMDLPSTGQVTALHTGGNSSDIVKFISANELAKLWYIGENNYAKVPPHSLLSVPGWNSPVVVETISMQADDKKAFYIINAYENLPVGPAKDIVFVVDPWCYTFRREDMMPKSWKRK